MMEHSQPLFYFLLMVRLVQKNFKPTLQTLGRNFPSAVGVTEKIKIFSAEKADETRFLAGFLCTFVVEKESHKRVTLRFEQES